MRVLDVNRVGWGDLGFEFDASWLRKPCKCHAVVVL